MKKILFTLLLILFLVPGVNADECVNLYEAAPGNLYEVVADADYTYYYSSKDGKSYYYVSLDSSKTYLFYATLDGQLVDRLLLTTTPSATFGSGTYIPDGFAGNTKKITNRSSFRFVYINPPAEDVAIYQSWQYWLVEGTEVCLPTSEEETEPDVPTEDEEDPVVIPDTTLDNFYSIYLDKLTSFANYSLENKFIFSSIVIILVFVFLELFIYLFKGGYR